MEYNPDPSFAGVPLSVAEVEEIASTGGRALRGNANWMSHFLSRVIATMRSAYETRQQLEGALERMKIDSQMSAGANTTLSPVDAVRYLSDEQKRVIFDGVARDKIEWLDLQASEIEKKRRQVETVYNALSFIGETSLQDSQVSDHPAMVKLRMALALAKELADAPVVQGRAPWHPIEEQL